MTNFSCIPRLSDSCICGPGDQAGAVIDGGEFVARIADELLHTGYISHDEHCELVTSDRVFREQERTSSSLRPRGRHAATGVSSRRRRLRRRRREEPAPPPSSRRSKSVRRISSNVASTSDGPDEVATESSAPAQGRGAASAPAREPIAASPPQQTILVAGKEARRSRRLVEKTEARKKLAKESGKPRTLAQPERDPITLEDVVEPCFEFKHKNLKSEKRICYNVASLVDYIVATGDFSEPTTRLAYSDAQLDQLDSLAARLGLGLGSVAEAKKNACVYEQQGIQRSMLEGLERCVGEVVAQMIDTMETADSEEELQFGLVTRFHEFDHYFQQLKEADERCSIQCLDQYCELVRGPPNKLRENKFGAKEILLAFFESKLALSSGH